MNQEETRQELLKRKRLKILHVLAATARTNDVWNVLNEVLDANITVTADAMRDETCTPEITQRRLGRYSALVELKEELVSLWEEAHKDIPT